MTIRKGEEWGERIATPKSFEIVTSDSDAAQMSPNSIFALTSGNLHHALGEPRVPQDGTECTRVQIDALHCRIITAGGDVLFQRAISHVCIGSWWRGPYVIVSNCGFVNGRNVTPRSHPNDGIFDILRVSTEMPLRQRVIAVHRSRTGTHLPHPCLDAMRGTTESFENHSGKLALRIDDKEIEHWGTVEISIEPDYWTIIL